jgi:hypothetical protein
MISGTKSGGGIFSTHPPLYERYINLNKMRFIVDTSKSKYIKYIGVLIVLIAIVDSISNFVLLFVCLWDKCTEMNSVPKPQISYTV